MLALEGQWQAYAVRWGVTAAQDATKYTGKLGRTPSLAPQL